MLAKTEPNASANPWTLKKAVTTLAIAPQTESLTRAGRMAYNVMIFKAQRMASDEEGGYTAPLSEIIKGFGSTTRDSSRIRAYIEQMCSTVVKWFPLSSSDEAQATIAGLDAPASDPSIDGRIFTLLSEARFSRRSGEQWVTWFFPPTIREMVIEPSRWAQLDIKELASLSHYAGVALYEICARYKDVPGGLTNKADPSWWVQALRSDPDTKPREWRKFKNETLKPAVAEISQRTSLDVKLVEYKQGRAVVAVQFAVKRKPAVQSVSTVDLALVEQAALAGVKEKDLDLLVDEFGDEQVAKALAAMQGRQRAQPTVQINIPLAYLRKSLRNGAGPLFEPAPADKPEHRAGPLAVGTGQEVRDNAWLEQRKRELNDELDALTPDELEVYANLAKESMSGTALGKSTVMKRFAAKQYRAPMAWERIRSAYAAAKYGPHWKLPPVN
jgi:hypothetical protein